MHVMAKHRLPDVTQCRTPHVRRDAQQRRHRHTCSEVCVSSRLESVGDTLTNMSVLAVPPRLSLISIVSLWLRYGMCACRNIGHVS
jgi:hypothetical protein